MEKHKIELTDDQLKALSILVWCNPCRSGCIYSEMVNSNKQCDQCNFQLSQYELINIVDDILNKK